MIDLINNVGIDLYTKFAISAHAEDGISWLKNAQDTATTFAENNDANKLPELGLTAFILVLVAVLGSYLAPGAKGQGSKGSCWRGDACSDALG